MTDVEKGVFLSLFNRGGWVLDFTTSEFDAFTMRSIGVPLCERYEESKGGSLTSYIYEADDSQATKLLLDLLRHYEAHYLQEIESKSDKPEILNYQHYYGLCKNIADREGAALSVSIQKESMEHRFTSEYMRNQIDTLFFSREKNPTEAIGKSKELIESCCKTILDDCEIDYQGDRTLSKLIKRTMKCLNVSTDDIDEDSPIGGTVKMILSSLGNIACGVAELRNPYGTGHGKPDTYVGLTARHSKLAVGASVTLVEYLWDAHEWRSGKQS